MSIAPDKIPSVSKGRSLIFLITFYSIVIVFSIIILISAYTCPRSLGYRLRNFSMGLIRKALKTCANISHKLNDPKKLLSNSAIYAFNHQSPWETLVSLTFLPISTSIIAKEELTKIPVFGKALKSYGGLGLDRNANPKKLKQFIKNTQEAINNGHGLLMFPEGTRKNPETPYKSQTGIYLLYRHFNLPVIPVAHNSGLFWGKKFNMAPGVISVKVCDPIPPNLSKKDFLSRLDSSLLEATQSLLPKSIRQ